MSCAGAEFGSSSSIVKRVPRVRTKAIGMLALGREVDGGGPLFYSR